MAFNSARMVARVFQPCLVTVFVGFLVPEMKMGRTYLRPISGTSEGPTKERFQCAPARAHLKRCLSSEISEVSRWTAAEATRNDFG
jgi:hypothetical protein